MQLVPPSKKRQVSQAMTLRDAMNRMFDESFWDPWQMMTLGTDRALSEYARFVPGTDIAETDKAIEVSFDVPGYDPKKIDVSLDDGVLTVSGSTESNTEEKNKKWHRRECACGSFSQSVALPRDIDATGITCESSHGKLTIVIPKKKQEASSGKKLPITVR